MNAIVALCLVPGAPNAAAGAPKALVLWHAYRGKERTAIEEVVQRWNAGARGEHPRLDPLAVPYDAFADKISAAIPRGHGPDLFIFAHDRVGDWAASKVIEPIEFWMTEQHADRFIFVTVDALCQGDSLYGLPLAFKSAALFYNKALVPRPPRTTDELIAIGRQHTSPRAGRYGLVYDNVKLYFHAGWLFGFGGKLFDRQGRPGVNTEAAAASLAFARRLGGPGGIVPPESSPTLTTTLFNSGQAAMAISGPWLLAELSDRLPIGVVPLPVVSATGQRARPFLGIEAVMMSASSKHKDATFAAMRFVASDAMAVLRARRARQPVASKAAWRDPAVAADPVLAAFRSQLDSAEPMPATPEMRLVWSPYDMALQKVVGRDGDPAAALAEAEAEIRRYLQAQQRSASR